MKTVQQRLERIEFDIEQLEDTLFYDTPINFASFVISIAISLYLLTTTIQSIETINFSHYFSSDMAALINTSYGIYLLNGIVFGNTCFYYIIVKAVLRLLLKFYLLIKLIGKKHVGKNVCK